MLKQSSQLVVLCLAAIPVLACAQEPTRKEEKPGFTVRVLDEQGRPVSGAGVGFTIGIGDTGFSNERWFYTDPEAELDATSSPSGVLTDADGIAHFPGRREWLDAFGGVVARHAERRLIGVAQVEEGSTGVVDLKLYPEARVYGVLTSNELVAAGKSFENTSASILLNDRLITEYWSREPRYAFELPPGKYKLSARGTDTHHIQREFEVPVGAKELDLGVLDLPPTELTMLIGREAPELTGIVDWMNTPGPLKLSELRGKVVMLVFWGHWCGPCIGHMPHLFALHDKHQTDGLVIIGVHLDVGFGVDTPEELMEKLAEPKAEYWQGRDIPFPIALAADEQVPHKRDHSKAACGRPAADYGVYFYPTQVLIDRQGKVVGKYYETEEHQSKLLELLGKP